MVEEGLIVRFQGDATPLEKGSKQAQSAIESVGKAASTMAKSSAVMGGSLDKAAKSSGTATQALMNLSRVAQDAPYGFMGIANNLNPLLESFQRLRAETGSNKLALQSLVASMTGPAGIGLALGVVSSLLVTFGDSLFSGGNDAKSMKLEVENLARALEYLATESRRITDDFERDSKIRVAALKAEADASGENGQRIYEEEKSSLEKRRELLRQNSFEITRQLGKVQANRSFDVGVYDFNLKEGKQMEGIYAKFKELSDRSAEIAKEEADTVAAIQILASQNLERIRKERENAEEQAAQKADAARKKTLAELKTHHRLMEEERWRFVKAMTDSHIQKPFGFSEDFAKDLQPTYDKVKLKPITIPARIDIVSGPIDNGGVIAGVNDMFHKLMQLGPMIEGVLTPAFQNLFSAITAGEAPLKAFFNSIMQSVTDLINKLIAAAIQALILSFLTGGAGGGFSGIFSKLTGLKFGKHAAGGLAYGPSIGMIGEYANAGSNPEVIAPLSKLRDLLSDVNGGGGGGEFRIRGYDLALLNNRVGRKQGRSR